MQAFASALKRLLKVFEFELEAMKGSAEVVDMIKCLFFFQVLPYSK